MISLLLLNNFYPVISYNIDEFKKGRDELLCTVSVTRYGPRISCQPKELTSYVALRTSRNFCLQLQHSLSFKYI